MPATPREHTRTYFLGKLARELELRGLTATLRPGDPPSLRVSGPDAALLTETVDCVPLAEGWFYRWSWGEVLERVENPEGAADRVTRLFAGPDRATGPHGTPG